jgi:hypothetical protein
VGAVSASQSVAKSNEAAGLRGSSNGNRQVYSNGSALSRANSVIQGS